MYMLSWLLSSVAILIRPLIVLLMLISLEEKQHWSVKKLLQSLEDALHSQQRSISIFSNKVFFTKMCLDILYEIWFHIRFWIDKAMKGNCSRNYFHILKNLAFYSTKSKFDHLVPSQQHWSRANMKCCFHFILPCTSLHSPLDLSHGIIYSKATIF